MTMQQEPVYKRILLKLSGEALMGDKPFGIEAHALDRISKDIADLVRAGVQVAIVIGGGNIFRGQKLSKTGLDRITCDQVGMLATVMNGLVLRDSFIKHGLSASVMSSIPLQGVAETYVRSEAVDYLKCGRIVIFVAGTGCPLFSTDSGASLRGIEIGANILLKATQVDGVYSDDPLLNPDAVRYDKISYQEAIEKQLKFMDTAALALCREHNLPVRVFNNNILDILKRIVFGSEEGTLITN